MTDEREWSEICLPACTVYCSVVSVHHQCQSVSQVTIGLVGGREEYQGKSGRCGVQSSEISQLHSTIRVCALMFLPIQMKETESQK